MKVEEIEITHFEKGMIDSIEAGQPFNNDYNSPMVKYLENLTPNLIQGALLKRPNYETFAFATPTNTLELPALNRYSSSEFLDYAGKNYVSGYGVHKWIRVPNPADPDEQIYVDMKTGVQVQPAWQFSHLRFMDPSRSLLGMTRFDMRNPIAGSVYVVMFRDDIMIANVVHETTTVNGHYFSKSLDALATEGFGWLNPLYDDEYLDWVNGQYTGMPFVKKGSRINGKVQDWVTVGQALYLVSVPHKIHEALPALPAYRWSPILEADVDNMPAVFPDTKVKRTYYWLNADSTMKVQSSNILVPYANGLYQLHPQYKGSSDLSMTTGTAQRAEAYDWDGIKDSIDILWWQTNKLPRMRDMTSKSIKDIDPIQVAGKSPDRFLNLQNNFGKADVVAGNLTDARAFPTTFNGNVASVLVPNVASTVNTGSLTAVTYSLRGLPKYTKDADYSTVVLLSTRPTGPDIEYVGHYGPQPLESSPYLGQRLIMQLDIPAMDTISTQATGKRYIYAVYGANGQLRGYGEEVWEVLEWRHDDPDNLYNLTTGETSAKSNNAFYPSDRMDYGEGIVLPISIPAFDFVNNKSYAVMPDYLNYDAPRFWQVGSKIPYVLTAVVSGVEFIVLQSTYEVAFGDEQALLNQNTLQTMSIFLGKSQTLAFAGKILEKTISTENRTENFAHINHMPLVCFTLRMNIPQTASLANYIPSTLTSFKLYASMPDLTSSGFFTATDNEWAVGSYCKPLVTDDTSKAYSLVKEFLVREDLKLQTDGIADDFYSFGSGEQGSKAVAHGKWVKFPSPEPSFAQAAGPQLIDNGGSGYYYVPYNNGTFTDNPTPDFYLWDYPIGPALSDSLGTLTTRWDGIGARCITHVSNRVVIAGTIDKDGTEEIGRIRGAAVQGTTMLNTVFGELDALDIASTPIEALANFRNDLWVFSRNSIVRITPTNPYDMTTWQIADTITGQGILHKKHMVQTPTGIYFANSTGLWFANGSEIRNVAIPVLSTFQYLYNTNQSAWQGYNKYNVAPHSELHTPSLELSYDAYRNEVVMSVQSFRYADNLASVPANHSVDLQLRYHVELNNFHLQTMDLPSGRHLTNKTQAFSEVGRVRFTDVDGKLVIPMLFDRTLAWVKGGNAYYDDMRLNYTYDWLERLTRPIVSPMFYVVGFAYRMWYAGWVTLHEVGNGMDDYLLRQVIVEVTPIEHDLSAVISQETPLPIAWRDPKLFIQYRNRETRMWAAPAVLPPVPFPVAAGTYDLVELNTRLVNPNNLYWSHLNMPVLRAWSRESIVLNTPLDAKFRRLEPTFITTSLTYLKSFRFKMAKYTRKTFG